MGVEILNLEDVATLEKEVYSPCKILTAQEFICNNYLGGIVTEEKAEEHINYTCAAIFKSTRYALAPTTITYKLHTNPCEGDTLYRTSDRPLKSAIIVSTDVLVEVDGIQYLDFNLATFDAEENVVSLALLAEYDETVEFDSVKKGLLSKLALDLHSKGKMDVTNYDEFFV